MDEETKGWVAGRSNCPSSPTVSLPAVSTHAEAGARAHTHTMCMQAHACKTHAYTHMLMCTLVGGFLSLFLSKNDIGISRACTSLVGWWPGIDSDSLWVGRLPSPGLPQPPRPGAELLAVAGILQLWFPCSCCASAVLIPREAWAEPHPLCL